MPVRKKRKAATKTSSISLPTEKKEVSNNVEDSLIFLYGPPKIGKSTFCSKIEDALFISTEPGLKFLSVLAVDCNSWQDFQAIVDSLENSHDRYSCFVIDTVDILQKFCSAYVCENRNIDHPSDQEWGKGWEALSREWSHWLIKLAALGKGVIFIGHAQEKEVKSRGMTITKIVPSMPNAGFKVINAMVDFILFAGFESKKIKKDGKTKRVEHRVLYTKATEGIEAGDRLGILPITIEFDYDTFEEHFKGGGE